jgi:hypothetical protein
MKAKTPLQSVGLLIVFTSIVVSCIPDNIKDQMNENLSKASSMFADQEFKKAIGFIELHKLRNGSYPASLHELQFLSELDSTTFSFVEYHKLDSGYELNVNFKFPSLAGKDEKEVRLKYPPEFWKGLGCVRSNAK